MITVPFGSVVTAVRTTAVARTGGVAGPNCAEVPSAEGVRTIAGFDELHTGTVPAGRAVGNPAESVNVRVAVPVPLSWSCKSIVALTALAAILEYPCNFKVMLAATGGAGRLISRSSRWISWSAMPRQVYVKYS